MPALVIFGGLPGSGKTTIARELARQLAAVYLRIDSIEQAIRDSGVVNRPLDDAGYRVGYALAEDNLRLGRPVVADSVNPLQLTRDAWIEIANRAHARAIEIETVCSDLQQHRRRVETRTTDIDGMLLPTWQEIVTREYELWNREHILIDTTQRTVVECVAQLLEALQER